MKTKKDKKAKKERRHRCTGCGKLFPESQIHFEEDPYASEIYDDHTPVWKCEPCRDEAAADI